MVCLSPSNPSSERCYTVCVPLLYWNSGRPRGGSKRFGDGVAELVHLKADMIVTSAGGAPAILPSPRARDCEVCRLDASIAQNDT